MLLIQLTINVFTLGGLLIAALVTGFLFRSGQIKKSERKIAELEKEMVTSHAEILELQQEKLALEEKLRGSSNIPVIPITSKDEKKTEKAPDKSISKK
jgi:hypothetical protein